MTQERKTYSFNGASLRLKPNDLELLKNASPLILKHRQLLYEYTKDIDMSEADRCKDRILELEAAIKQLEENKPDDKNRIDILMNELNEAKDEFENDYKVQSLIKLYSECEGLALMELVTDAEFIKPFLRKILIPVSGNAAEFEKIDFGDLAVVGFINEVVMDFFSIITGNSSIFKA